MARRVATAILLVVGIGFFFGRPLAGLILVVSAGAIHLDGKGAFGHGVWRAMIAFITSLWVALAGVVATLLGMVVLPECDDTGAAACVPSGANVLLVPGFVLLALGLALLAWSIVEAVRLRRGAIS